MSDNLSLQAKKTADFIRQELGEIRPGSAVVLGSGLNSVAEKLLDNCLGNFAYSELPGYPELTVSGHEGRLFYGEANARPVLVLQGRSHYYEHGNASAMALPLHTCKALGCDNILLTCAAGSLQPELGPGRLTVITDHINLTGINPLIGQTGNRRFISLENAYDKRLRETLQRAASLKKLQLGEGVLMWFPGPSFETPAEIRLAQVAGANVVGMSVVPECIISRYLGMQVAAVAMITNYACGMSTTPLSHEQTITAANANTCDFQALLHAYLRVTDT